MVKEFLELSSGIPTHVNFGRVFARIYYFHHHLKSAAFFNRLS
jgi:hypothetical protein